MFLLLLHRKSIDYLVDSPLICHSLGQGAVIELIQCPSDVQATIVLRKEESFHYLELKSNLHLVNFLVIWAMITFIFERFR
jgi:hypothetical protein